MDHYSYVTARSREVLANYGHRAGKHSLEQSVGADGGSEPGVARRIEDVALGSGLEVVEYPDLPEGALGELDPGEGIICVRPDLDPSRRAFVIAHEIGHYALGHEGRIVDTEQHIDERVGPDELVAQDGVQRAYNSRDFIEIEANLFAAELLAPTTLLLERIKEDPGWSPAKLADQFGISLTAMLTRLANVLLLGNGPEETVGGILEESEPTASQPVPPAKAPELHPRQREAVGTDTPALVVAGPGAGKTRVLAERYAHLVRSGARPEEILALTFSNKAAGEMRTRVAQMLGDEVGEEAEDQRVKAYTFHGFGLETLKGYYHLVGLPEDFTLLTEADALLLVRSRLSELELAHFENLSDPGLHLPDILAAISRAKDELRSPDDFESLAREMHAAVGDTNGEANDDGTEEQREAAGKALEAAKIYRAYGGWLEEAGYVDYGDLVRLAVEVLGTTSPAGVAESITEGYQHILVDEFQDINFASGRLLRTLDRGRGVVWAVADPDQSIYRFRGASPANLERFGEDYPGYRTVHLTKNYRSNPDIVGCSQGVRQSLHATLAEDKALPGKEAGSVAESTDGQPPPLESAREAGDEPAVSLAVASDGEAELEYLVGQVHSRKERGVPLGDQAVLCSTNAQARAIVARLSAAGLEAQGPVSLLGSSEIKDALAVVSLLRTGGSAGGASLVRVAGFDENPLTEQEAGTVVRWARKQQLSVREALGQGHEVDGLDEAASAYLADLGRFLDELPGWGDAYHAILAYTFHPDSRVRKLLTGPAEDTRRRLLSLGQLAILARTFADREDLVEGEGIPGFLEYVRELVASKKGDGALYVPPSTTSKGGDGGATDAVQVMTVHKSKGLEFPVVYVPNLARGRFPVRMGGGGGAPVPAGLAHHAESQDNEQEDRCLFYVALTRAEDELVLSRAERYGRATRKPIPLIDSLVREADGRVMVLDRTIEDSDAAGESAQELRWSPLSDGGDDTSHSGSEAYSFRQIDRYGKCSLQFKYAEVLELAEERSGYQDFHNCVYQVLSEMEIEARKTGENPSLSWATEQFDSIWEEEGPAGHFYEPVYRRRAQNVVENWQAAGRALTWRLREKIEPPLASPVAGEAQLEVTADAIGRGENGELLVARHRFGRPRKSHTEGEKQDLLALYAAGGRYRYDGEEEVRVVLHYLVGDEIVEATPTDRVISNRLKKISGRVEDARAGRYPPNPGQICKSCQYNLICPASS